jgi:1-acyl-sn-glycerol-3-phosphate acyltransferase
MTRKFLRIFFRLLVRLLTKTRLSGLENIPTTGGAVFAVNHLSVIDPVFIFVHSPRADMTALVAKKHQNHPILAPVVNGAGGIWINRDEADTHAIRTATNFLKNGGIVGLAPEGTRSESGQLIPAKTGAAYLAERAGVPVIPVAITGTHHGVARLAKLERLRVTLEFGEPVMVAAGGRKEREAALQQATDEVMCQIAAMLPPELRGHYAQFPRTLELLAAEGRE